MKFRRMGNKFPETVADQLVKDHRTMVAMYVDQRGLSSITESFSKHFREYRGRLDPPPENESGFIADVFLGYTSGNVSIRHDFEGVPVSALLDGNLGMVMASSRTSRSHPETLKMTFSCPGPG